MPSTLSVGTPLSLLATKEAKTSTLQIGRKNLIGEMASPATPFSRDGNGVFVPLAITNHLYSYTHFVFHTLMVFNCHDRLHLLKFKYLTLRNTKKPRE